MQVHPVTTAVATAATTVVATVARTAVQVIAHPAVTANPQDKEARNNHVDA